MEKLVLRGLDDWHFHPRDEDSITEMVMADLLSSGFVRGIPIFNYKDPIDTAPKLEQEMERLSRIAPNFEFVPSIILTRDTTPTVIQNAGSLGCKVIKWIVDGLSTNSQNGINWETLPEKYDALRQAEQLGWNAMVHMEDSLHDAHGRPITHPVFREALALPKFDSLARLFPGLFISIEHVSTKEAVDYIRLKAPFNVRGGLTTHHLFRTIYHVYDRDGRINSNKWCMPVYKFLFDQEALIQAATSGNPRFFYASDKAPHRNKNPLSPVAGVYTGKVDICLLAELFESRGALHYLNDFLSRHGAEHYGLPLNQGRVVLRKHSWVPPAEVGGIRIFGDGRELSWMVK